MACAQLVLTGDQRALVVEAAGSIQSAFPAPAFSVFNTEIERNVPSGGGNGLARASQDSTVSAGAMNATGGILAESHAGPAGCIFSQATSDFRIEFHVTTPVQYAIEGSVDGAQFRLAEALSGTLHLALSPSGSPLPYSFDGILKPGRMYVVLAQASDLANACSGGNAMSAGAYTMGATFTALPPCPSDLNFDRVVNDADFQIFLHAYNDLLCPEEPLPCDSDLNGDGFVNDADFQIFLQAYNQLLCPEDLPD